MDDIGPVTLSTLRFEGSTPGPHLLITGGVHGDEFTPMAAIRRLGSTIVGQDLAGRLTLVPVVNEAAFARGERTAEDELDLARVCPGDPEGSITQRTAHALSRLILASDYYIDLHTGSRTFSLFPLTGYTLHTDPEVLKQQRAMARAFNLPIIWGTDPSLNGRSLSVARDAGIPAIYAEYLGSGLCDPQGVQDYVDGCLNVMAQLGMTADRTISSRIEHLVEDERPGSGHMQVQHPSPAAGFFEPLVELGTRVQRGQSLGTVVDSRGTLLAEIPANETGLVLGLRTFSRLCEGDFVAVVLPVPT